LLTYDDFYIVVHADENVNPLVEGGRAIAFGGHNYSGYSLIGGGMRITPSGNFKEKMKLLIGSIQVKMNTKIIRAVMMVT
jgi:hypothetical protein